MKIEPGMAAYDYLEQLVQLKGVKNIIDLWSEDKKKVYMELLSYNEMDAEDFYASFCNINKLIKNVLDDIDDEEYLGLEIMDRVGEYFDPAIDKCIQEIYADQYGNNRSESMLNNPAYDQVFCDQREIAREWNQSTL